MWHFALIFIMVLSYELYICAFKKSGYIFHGSSIYSFFMINVPILQVLSRYFNNQHFKYLCYLSADRLHLGKIHSQT